MSLLRRSFSCLILIHIFDLEVAGAQPTDEAVQLTPAVIEAGAPELIRVVAPGAATIDGDWMGHKLEFFHGHEGGVWFALAGVDVESAIGPSVLQVRIKISSGSERDLSRTIDIHEAHYRTGTLSVEPKFVEPPPEALAEFMQKSRSKTKYSARVRRNPCGAGVFVHQ